MFDIKKKEVKETKNQKKLETVEENGITYNIWEVKANSDGKTLQGKIRIPVMEDIDKLEETDIVAIYTHFVSDILTDTKNFLRSQIKSDEELKAKKDKLQAELEKIDSLLED